MNNLKCKFFCWQRNSTDFNSNIFSVNEIKIEKEIKYLINYNKINQFENSYESIELFQTNLIPTFICDHSINNELFFLSTYSKNNNSNIILGKTNGENSIFLPQNDIKILKLFNKKNNFENFLINNSNGTQVYSIEKNINLSYLTYSDRILSSNFENNIFYLSFKNEFLIWDIKCSQSNLLFNYEKLFKKEKMKFYDIKIFNENKIILNNNLGDIYSIDIRNPIKFEKLNFISNSLPYCIDILPNNKIDLLIIYKDLINSNYLIYNNNNKLFKYNSLINSLLINPNNSAQFAISIENEPLKLLNL